MEQNWKTIAFDTKNHNQESRIQTAFHLKNQSDDESCSILGKGLLTDPSPIVRHEFAFSLGETSHSRDSGISRDCTTTS
ncbi:hypothetical protein HYZ97_03255 [Candidatus Pacearchaeota archaeon]|nr:hypothetical protein [Candidatus Pacearchaeota archaeon]